MLSLWAKAAPAASTRWKNYELQHLLHLRDGDRLLKPRKRLHKVVVVVDVGSGISVLNGRIGVKQF